MNCTLARLLAIVLLCLGATTGPSLLGQTVNVTSWHNDIGRTGQNTNETALTTALVGNDDQFGRLCSASVDGKVYAQPLIVTNVKFSNNTTYPIVAYVVTQNDSVYAFDGTNCISFKRRVY